MVRPDQPGERRNSRALLFGSSGRLMRKELIKWRSSNKRLSCLTLDWVKQQRVLIITQTDGRCTCIPWERGVTYIHVYGDISRQHSPLCKRRRITITTAVATLKGYCSQNSLFHASYTRLYIYIYSKANGPRNCSPHNGKLILKGKLVKGLQDNLKYQ